MAKNTRDTREAGTREERAQVWAERARGWRESGQTQAQYCAERGISVWMLRKWIVDLGAESRLPKSRLNLRPPKRALMLPIPLHLAGPGLMAAQSAGHETAHQAVHQAALEIALPNGTRIRATGVTATELTRAIARVLRC